MKNIFRNPKRSLAAKLIIAIGMVMLTGSFVFWYATLYKQEKDLTTIAVKYGDSFINFIKESTRHSMLTFQRTAIQQTLEDTSIAEGVERLRIFDHSGKIIYSSNKSDISRLIDKTSLACKGCHLSIEKPSEFILDPVKWKVLKSQEGNTSLKLVEPIYNESVCYTSACHIHSKEKKILGFIEADMSLALLDEARLKQGIALTAYVVIFFVAISIALGFILYKIVSKPISELAHGMGKVASGDLDYSVPINSEDEMGTLARTFNSMIFDIKAARDQRERWTETLQAEIAKKTEEMRKTHASLVQTEKLASLGRMSAGVAHEINNPLTGIVTFAHLLKKRVSPGSTDEEDLDMIIEQAERCTKIIKNLLTFSRITPSEKGEININDMLNRTIYMVKNQVRFHNIKFNIEFEQPSFIVLGDASQFQQIFLNMFINAADAMSNKGTITIVTRRILEDNAPYVEIEFSDTGCGMSEETLGKLFEPFFTTKPVGKGTGLGLSVSHGIVKHYGGSISVKSTIGKGTSFFVKLPLIDQEI